MPRVRVVWPVGARQAALASRRRPPHRGVLVRALRAVGAAGRRAVRPPLAVALGARAVRLELVGLPATEQRRAAAAAPAAAPALLREALERVVVAAAAGPEARSGAAGACAPSAGRTPLTS